MASTARSARRKVISALSVPKTAFMSRRKSGRFQSVEIVFTQRLLPQPEIPIRRIPLGIGIPASRASFEKRACRFTSHSLSVA